MNSFVMFAVFALAAVANCEPPSGYNYNRPASIGSGVSSAGNTFGGGAFGGSGGGYQQEAIGASTNEGLNVDPELLEKVKQILLREESQASAGGHSAGGFGGAPSSSYGVPQAQYGPPAQQPARVVGIILENTQPAIQVAQYKQQSQAAGGVSGGFGGYPSGPSSFGVAPAVNAPSSSYGVPAAPARPSSSYGAPF
ncbi:hypothetical protein PVAND_011153 [Polypedilum vanderplanki]|uniref:Uncharacterized protein n=1 Tax=Polypedilum vanderplanki TaxID=319348 RepID=A0A9J6CIM3_POLVA|nr:hypothetical protein PVAND_011153 [Polypedilum vanderplanki]